MRKPVSRKARVPKGARVSCACTLSKNASEAILGVFTATPGFDLAPYVETYKLDIRTSAPMMHKPMYTTLRQHVPAHTFEFTADEDMFVQILQDIDSVKDETSANVKVNVHGKIASQVRWLLRDAFRAFRDRYAAIHRHP